MKPLGARLRRVLFGLNTREVEFARRGFHAEDESVRVRLEDVGRTFLIGYHVGLEEEVEALGAALVGVPVPHRGFAFEGAAMAFALRDALWPFGPSLLSSLAAGSGAPHAYMVTVGAGWAWALLRLDAVPRGLKLDSAHGWLALDGVGFYYGYFHSRRAVHAARRPRGLHGYAARAFDQGLGRSLWFVDGARVAAVAERIAGFSEDRRGDLWSGVGLASAYAGGADADQVFEVASRSGSLEHFAQGVAFAAEARDRAGNPADHTAGLAQRVWGRTCADVALRVRELRDVPPSAGDTNSTLPDYELWRARVRHAFLTELS